MGIEREQVWKQEPPWVSKTEKRPNDYHYTVKNYRGRPGGTSLMGRGPGALRDFPC